MAICINCLTEVVCDGDKHLAWPLLRVMAINMVWPLLWAMVIYTLKMQATNIIINRDFGNGNRYYVHDT